MVPFIATCLNDRILRIASGATLELSELTMTGGIASNVVGGLFNAGTISLSHVEVTGNSAGTRGGGISA